MCSLIGENCPRPELRQNGRQQSVLAYFPGTSHTTRQTYPCTHSVFTVCKKIATSNSDGNSVRNLVLIFLLGHITGTRHFRVSSSSRLSKTHPHKSKLLRSGLAEARSKGAYVSTVLLSVCEVLKRQGIEIIIEAQEHLCAVHSHLLGRFYR